MQTLPQPPVNAKYATIDAVPTTIARVNDVLYAIFEDRIERFEVEMALNTVILGDVALAETAAMWDRIAGGFAAVACSRDQGRS